jgi:hypothetical protein
MPAPPYTPRMELNASVLLSETDTKSITDCGLTKAIRLTERRLIAHNAIKPPVTFLKIFVFFILIWFNGYKGVTMSTFFSW